MNKSNDKQGKDSSQPEKKPRCDQTQLKRLKECSNNKDVTDWNKWRKENPDEEIWLQGAMLRRAHLEGADLEYAHLEGAYLMEAHLGGAYLMEARLEGAYFIRAHLEGADLAEAHLEGANLRYARLESADLAEAHLEGADLRHAHLEGANLGGAHLEGADLRYAHLEGADFRYAHLEGANFEAADLTKADFSRCDLQDAQFSTAIVDGRTCIWKCCVNQWKPTINRGSGIEKRSGTDFSGVPLDAVRIDPANKQLLEYNIRRKYWYDWFWGNNEHIFVPKVLSQKPWWIRFLVAAKTFVRVLVTTPVSLFWGLSKYGCSIPRITFWFVVFALFFALYYLWIPECLLVNGTPGNPKDLLHAFYFSIVTMTTLGFGDIAANPSSHAGQILLMFQVILGYILLGAIITRFAVLFRAGGPAGEFTPMHKKAKELLKRIAEIRKEKNREKKRPLWCWLSKEISEGRYFHQKD